MFFHAPVYRHLVGRSVGYAAAEAAGEAAAASASAARILTEPILATTATGTVVVPVVYQ